MMQSMEIRMMKAKRGGLTRILNDGIGTIFGVLMNEWMGYLYLFKKKAINSGY